MDESPRDSQEGSHRGRLFQRVRIVGLLTLLSRILGLFRDAMMVASFGNGVIIYIRFINYLLNYEIHDLID